MDHERASPVIDSDAWLYQAAPDELDFVFATRASMDWGDGLRFDANFVKARGWHVGLLPFDRGDGEEIRFQHLFSTIDASGVSALFGCAAISKALAGSPELPVDRQSFHPPLVGKVPPSMDGFVAVRRSLIGIYSGAYYLIPPGLEFGLLDVNGHYTLLAGKRAFVEMCIQWPIEASWQIVHQSSSFRDDYLLPLREACKAYGF